MVVVYDAEHGCTGLCLKPIYKIDFAHFNKQFFLLSFKVNFYSPVK